MSFDMVIGHIRGVTEAQTVLTFHRSSVADKDQETDQAGLSDAVASQRTDPAITQHIDPSTGRSYYYNPNTQETSWF